MSVRSSFVALVALVLACAVPSAAWAGPISANQDLSLTATVLVPLPTGGFDSVNLAGVIHTSTYQSSMDAQGNCRVRFHANAAGVSGVGATTGLQYLLVGASAIAFPPDPCANPVLPPTLIFTLLPTTSNNLYPPDPCDITFQVSFVTSETGQVGVSVSIQLVEVPIDN